MVAPSGARHDSPSTRAMNASRGGFEPMIRFLYGCLCLICLLVLSASLFGWVRSDRASAGAATTDADATSRTFHARGYQIEGRHARGVATLIAAPEQSNVTTAAPATQPAVPASPRWQVGPAAFD